MNMCFMDGNDNFVVVAVVWMRHLSHVIEMSIGRQTKRWEHQTTFVAHCTVYVSVIENDDLHDRHIIHHIRAPNDET